MSRIVIADDHGLYRRGLRLALAAHFDDADFYEAGSYAEALALLAEKGPVDLAIIDLNMPDSPALDVVGKVLEQYPNTRIAIISGSESRADILATLSAGLHGYIVKSQPDVDITEAVHHILTGHIYVPSLISRFSRDSGEKKTAGVQYANEMTYESDGLEDLTPRQLDVLRLVAEGRSNKEIARDLDIAEATAKIHVGAVMRALGVRNRTAAAVCLNGMTARNRSPRL